MNTKVFLFTTLLLALVLSVLAAPLQDVSVTSVDLAEESVNNKGDEHLFVTVTRVDDLVDDDGSILAERVMAVRVTFDVVENQLRCNGVPVAIGVSNIQVEAQMASDPTKLTVESAEELALLQDSFDIGLATVEVTATLMDQMTTEEGLTFRRIAVQEKITEINHEKVVQTNAGQQLLDIFDNGRLDRWNIDPTTGFLLPDLKNNDDLELPHPTIYNGEPTVYNGEPTIYNVEEPTTYNGEEPTVYEGQPIAYNADQEVTLANPWFVPDNFEEKRGGCSDLIDPVVQWWNAQSGAIRGTITGAFCAFFFAVALFVRHLIVSANKAYEALPLYGQDNDDSADQEAIWKDKAAAPPPSYEPAHGDEAHEEKRPFVA